MEIPFSERCWDFGCHGGYSCCAQLLTLSTPIPFFLTSLQTIIRLCGLVYRFTTGRFLSQQKENFCLLLSDTSCTFPPALSQFYEVVVRLFKALLLNQFSWLAGVCVSFAIVHSSGVSIMSRAKRIFLPLPSWSSHPLPYLLRIVNVTFMTELVLFMNWHSWHLLCTNQLSLCAFSCVLIMLEKSIGLRDASALSRLSSCPGVCELWSLLSLNSYPCRVSFLLLLSQMYFMVDLHRC